jgi:hypothetical protein
MVGRWRGLGWVSRARTALRSSFKTSFMLSSGMPASASREYSVLNSAFERYERRRLGAAVTAASGPLGAVSSLAPRPGECQGNAAASICAAGREAMGRKARRWLLVVGESACPYWATSSAGLVAFPAGIMKV